MTSVVRNLWGRITGSDAKKNYPQQQGKSLGRIGNYLLAQPYGLYANAPNGQLFKVLDEDGNVIIAVTVARPDGVEPGEVTLHHPAAGSKIHLKNNGDVDIESTGDVNITATTKVSIVAPVTEITGALLNNGVNISSTHVHAQTNDSGGNAEQDTEVPM